MSTYALPGPGWVDDSESGATVALAGPGLLAEGAVALVAPIAASLTVGAPGPGLVDFVDGSLAFAALPGEGLFAEGTGAITLSLPATFTAALPGPGCVDDALGGNDVVALAGPGLLYSGLHGVAAIAPGLFFQLPGPGLFETRTSDSATAGVPGIGIIAEGQQGTNVVTVAIGELIGPTVEAITVSVRELYAIAEVVPAVVEAITMLQPTPVTKYFEFNESPGPVVDSLGGAAPVVAALSSFTPRRK